MSFITAIYNIISTSRIKTDNVHHALDFNQSPCLKQYIDFNTQKIANAKTHLKKTSLNSRIIQYLVRQWKIYESEYMQDLRRAKKSY